MPNQLGNAGIGHAQRIAAQNNHAAPAASGSFAGRVVQVLKQGYEWLVDVLRSPDERDAMQRRAEAAQYELIVDQLKQESSLRHRLTIHSLDGHTKRTPSRASSEGSSMAIFENKHSSAEALALRRNESAVFQKTESHTKKTAESQARAAPNVAGKKPEATSRQKTSQASNLTPPPLLSTMQRRDAAVESAIPAKPAAEEQSSPATSSRDNKGMPSQDEEQDPPPPPLPPRPQRSAIAPTVLADSKREASQHAPMTCPQCGSLPVSVTPHSQASNNSIRGYRDLRSLIANETQTNSGDWILYNARVPADAPHFQAVKSVGFNPEALWENHQDALSQITNTLQEILGYGEAGSAALRKTLPSILTDATKPEPMKKPNSGYTTSDLFREGKNKSLDVIMRPYLITRADLNTIVTTAHAIAAQLAPK